MKREGVRVTGWVCAIEAHGNKSTIKYLMNQQGAVVEEPTEMCTAFQANFALLFRCSGGMQEERIGIPRQATASLGEWQTAGHGFIRDERYYGGT